MRETITRSISGLIYILLLLSAISYSRETFLLLFGAFLLIAVYEFCAMIQLNKTVPLIIAAIAYFLLGYFTSAYPHNDLILALVTLFISIRLIIFLFNEKRLIYDVTSKYVTLLGYIILPMIIITKIPMQQGIYNPQIIIGIFILIWTNDTFAYIVGKSIGKTKLLEKISPKKTIEGFIGGVIFALIFSILIAKYITHQPIHIWIISALIIGVFGTIGDLIESKFKRIAGIKDSGKIMPGHGGILDRLDSVIFVAPFVFLFYQIINYVS
ncbi:phosphatidate cytidylyltransferase [Flavobacterium sp. '19STA2R22 D10 B1']|uniref:phosphatidate cytidylyltransferase n=1 Tax=Flavobacterium aerium TaxID=3037261 RepID=UPI00278C1B2B|nr:phosphatidate cytidylyltransferase [Flavobacterium sp. '19STA2R22 D10 B1']